MELDNDLDKLTAVLRRLLQQIKVHVHYMSPQVMTACGA